MIDSLISSSVFPLACRIIIFRVHDVYSSTLAAWRRRNPLHHRSIIQSLSDQGIRLLVSILSKYLYYVMAFLSQVAQSGAKRFALIALLLLTLPLAFTYQVLFALPRFALRRRTFWALAYTPYAFMSCNGFGLIPATFLSLHEHLLYVYPSIRSVML